MRTLRRPWVLARENVPPAAWDTSRWPTTVPRSASTASISQAGHVLRKIAPVRADVAQRGAGAAAGRIEPPGVHALIGQPVLEVLPMHVAERAELAPAHHGPRLLHQRIAAVVECHHVRDAGAPCRLPEHAAVLRAVRQRLVRDHVLARRQCRERDLEMQVVGSCVVNDVDGRIGDELAIIAVCPLDAPCGGAAARRVNARAGQCHDFNVTQAAHRLDVLGGDEAGTNQAHAQTFQCKPLSRHVTRL